MLTSPPTFAKSLLWLLALAAWLCFLPLATAAPSPAPEAPAVERDIHGFLPMDQTGLDYKTEGQFHVWYPPAAERSSEKILEYAKEHRARIYRDLALQDERPIRVLLLPELNDYFRRRNLRPRAPHWAVGLAMDKEDTILIKWGADKNNQWVALEPTFAHELAHIALDRAAGESGDHIDGEWHHHAKQEGRRVPRWLHEGYAIMQAKEWDLERGTSLMQAALMDELIPLQKLHNGFPADGPAVELAYAEGYHFVHHLHQEYGPRPFGFLISQIREGKTFDDAFLQTYGKRFSIIEGEWRKDLDLAYTWIPALTGSSVFWGIGGLLFLLAWRKKHKISKERLEKMEAEEKRLAALRGPGIPLPGMGLTAEHASAGPWRILENGDMVPNEEWNGRRNIRGVFIPAPHIHHKQDQDRSVPRNQNGHTLH